MGWIQIQMVDGVSNQWWKDLIGHFVRVGDQVELRCWWEETEVRGRRPA